MKKWNKAFSVIEILIWIFIFTLWMSSIFMLIASSLNTNTYNKNQIIAWNLAREWLDLVRNIRDTNYKTFNPWNLIPYHWYNSIDYNDSSNYFSTWSYYKLENTFQPWLQFLTDIEDITIWFWEWKDELFWKMKKYELCLNSENLYTYDCTTSGNKTTKFYRYIYIDEVKDSNWIIKNAYKVKSKVIFYIKWYHEFELETIITDFKRL